MFGIQLIVHSFIHHQTPHRIGDSPQNDQETRRTKCKEEQNQDQHKDNYDSTPQQEGHTCVDHKVVHCIFLSKESNINIDTIAPPITTKRGSQLNCSKGPGTWERTSVLELEVLTMRSH